MFMTHLYRYSLESIEPRSRCIRGGDGDLTDPTMTLRDLDADTSYRLNVVARNSNGCSEPKEIIFKTGETKQSESLLMF